MIFYTSDDEKLLFNKARQKAFLSLSQTLNEAIEKEGVTEKGFADRWLENIYMKGDLYRNGWYDPPRSGIAVLSNERIDFDSLRNERFFSNDTPIDFKNGYLYAYCSPVEKSDGFIGDMSITLYFGKDERVVSHFRNVRGAIQEIFDSLSDMEYACDLYDHSLSVFEKRGLRSNMISRTDTSPSNLGHTFTHLDSIGTNDILSKEEIGHLSSSRCFINADAKWKFCDGMQFTIEPQLLSVTDPSLHKVTHHYVVKRKGDDFIVCNDIDLLLNRFGLI